MRHLIVPILASGALAAAPNAPAPDPTPLRGFTAQSWQVERDWETKFRAIPEPQRLREMMRRLSARPHHVGSPYDRQNAEWIRDQFASWGWDVHIENFDVLFPTPVDRAVELVAPTTYKAALQEPTVPEDPSSGQHAEQLPTYNAYSIDGDVTGPLVFVNYGVPADYEELERHGISVKGAIVIAKYGGSWRGIKPKVAAEHGAIGCLIYSDPGDDGYASGDVFPKGPMRPPQGVQRGSVADMPTYPGDPLTPGVGATKDAKRLPISQAPTLTKIPVLPISYSDAQPLLAALNGPVVPPAWRGGLPITYRFGPGAARVHLRVKSDWSLKTLYDVIARLPGTTEPDEWVIRGNHHDAWVNGAEDPISGLVAELEEARALGQLHQQGWRPKRTIIYAAWDGEEPGLLGSTEWAEAHADELSAHAVAYLNSDSNGRGYLSAEGSHSLEDFINGVEKDVEDPEAHVSAWKRNQAAAMLRGDADAQSAVDLRIGALGSGSDYTPFLQHLGIASLDLGFAGEDESGIYHSIYDDFYWYTHFDDTAFVYGRALAQTVGTSAMRLADADVLPFVFTNLAATTSRYVTELQTLRDARAKAIAGRRELIADSVYAIVSDPRDPTTAPKVELPPPRFDFAPLLDAQDSLSAAASRFEKAYASWRDHSGTALAGGVSDGRAEPTLSDVNHRLVQAERALLLADGLKNRPWYRHALYAPGYYTGYGVKTIPGVREAIEQGAWSDVNAEIKRAASALDREAGSIKEASVALQRAAAAPQ